VPSPSIPVRLIVPPVADVTMPMLGPHVLAGYLTEKKIDCTVHDLGIELLRKIASPLALQSGLVNRTRIPAHLAAIVEPGLEAIERYPDRLMRLAGGLKLFTFGHPGLWITPDEVKFSVPIRSRADLKRAVREIAPILSLAEDSIFCCLTPVHGQVIVGLSISFPSQLVMALAIAELIKRRHPVATVVLGGPYFDSLGFMPGELIDTFTFIDLIVRGPGEVPLERLARGSPLTGVVDGPVASRAVPDFSGVPWESYVSGTKAVPCSLGTACSYGRCRFCLGDRGRSIAIPGPRAETMVQGLIKLGVQAAYFVDASLSSSKLNDVATTAAGRLQWAANARPTGALKDPGVLEKLRAGGCRMLRFGLESGSQRVLDLMHKGTSIDEISGVLRATAEAGIRAHVYVMFGYPDETDADRAETLRFLEAHRTDIYSYSVSVFQPVPGTPVYTDLCERFGVHSEDVPHALAAINQRLFPDADHFDPIAEAIDRLSSILCESRSNRWSYSGRVFDQTVPSAMGPDPILLDQVYASPAQWTEAFSSVYLVEPADGSEGAHRRVFVDLAGDRVVVCSTLRGASDGQVNSAAIAFLRGGHAQGLASCIAPFYSVSRLSREWNSVTVLQYAPPFPRRTDAERD
jgi:anaerobic magnesium-protoporphyrin IX monomethyl ester cyclase